MLFKPKRTKKREKAKMPQKIWKKGRHSKKVRERERHKEKSTKAIARRLRFADAALKVIYVHVLKMLLSSSHPLKFFLQYPKFG